MKQRGRSRCLRRRALVCVEHIKADGGRQAQARLGQSVLQVRQLFLAHRLKGRRGVGVRGLLEPGLGSEEGSEKANCTLWARIYATLQLLTLTVRTPFLTPHTHSTHTCTLTLPISLTTATTALASSTAAAQSPFASSNSRSNPSPSSSSAPSTSNPSS